MKFIAVSSDLLKGLTKVIGVVPTKSTMPILENILFELQGKQLKLSATDIELYTSVTINVNGSEDGSITVPAKRLMDTIRALPDTSLVFHAETESNKITMITETGEYNITGVPSDEFPKYPEINESQTVTLPIDVLKRAIHKTIFAVSKDELRPSLMGVLFRIRKDYLTAVSTDGHRLVKYEHAKFNAQVETDIIIPAKALNVLSKLTDGEEATLSMSNTYVKFTIGASVLASRVIAETYPNYESVIPKDNNQELVISRDQLLSAIRRVSLYANNTTHQVRFSLRENNLTISAEDADAGSQAKENITCSYNNDNLDIGFNANYLDDVLVHIDNDNVRFRFSTPTRAGIIEPEQQHMDDMLLMLTMPLRLNN
jgi:DNA polymerase III subunit beta